MRLTMREMCLSIVICALMLLLPGFSPAAEISQCEKDSIFIGPTKIQPSVIELARQKGRVLELQRTYETLESQFTNALSATRIFQLVERVRKGDLELEQDYAAVVVDPNDRNIAQAGKMRGAKYAFLPQIDGFEDRAEIMGYQAIGQSDLNRTIFLSAVVQIVDTTTGEMLPEAPSIQLTNQEVLNNVRTGQAAGTDNALVAIAKEMAQKLSQEVVSLLRPAKVLAVTGRQVMINRGSDAGFIKGDMVEIYAVENVKDEDTGEVFRNELPMGTATIVRLDKKQSFAMIGDENLGIAKGCVVRIVQPASMPLSPPLPAETGVVATPGSSEAPLKW